MENNSMSSQINGKSNQQHYQNKVLTGCSKNFIGIHEQGHNERPLLVTTWTQTYGEDFIYLNEENKNQEHIQRENELMEKIKVLEADLRAHAELLTQIHATSARTSALLGQQQQQHQQQIKQQIAEQQQQQQSQKTIEEQQQQQPKSSPPPQSQLNGKNLTNLAQSSAAVINPQQSSSTSPRTESVKYTIIAECAGDVEPIEIQLAEDDGALNLNSSADSGRLEICLAPDDYSAEIKSEFPNRQETASPAYSATSTPTASNQFDPQFLKRRKLTVEKNDVLPQNSSYYFNEQGVLTSVNQSSGTTPPLNKRHSGNKILETPNMENNIKANMSSIHTTPLNSLMPNSHNNNNSMNSSVGSMFDTDNVMVSIGPNNTRIPAKVYENMHWNSASIATRKLLMAIFDRKTLATHSMTGKPSPAFKDHGKPLKKMLNPDVVNDIIFAVTRKCAVSEKEVRNAITTKCADENKMMKLQMNKRPPMRELNKENIST